MIINNEYKYKRERIYCPNLLLVTFGSRIAFVLREWRRKNREKIEFLSAEKSRGLQIAHGGEGGAEGWGGGVAVEKAMFILESHRSVLFRCGYASP